MNEKILFVKSIFVPTYDHLQICVNSIINMFEKICSLKLIHPIVIIGWCKKDIFKKVLEKLLNNYKEITKDEYYNERIDFIPWSINYGKIKILNYAFNIVKERSVSKNI